MKSNGDLLNRKFGIVAISAVALLLMATIVFPQAERNNKKAVKQTPPATKGDKGKSSAKESGNNNPPKDCEILTDGEDEPKLAVNTGNTIPPGKRNEDPAKSSESSIAVSAARSGNQVKSETKAVKVWSCNTDYDLPLYFEAVKPGAWAYRLSGIANSTVSLANAQLGAPIVPMNFTQVCDRKPVGGKIRVNPGNRRHTGNEVQLELFRKIGNEANALNNNVSRKSGGETAFPGYELVKIYRVQVTCPQPAPTPAELKPGTIKK